MSIHSTTDHENFLCANSKRGSGSSTKEFLLNPQQNPKFCPVPDRHPKSYPVGSTICPQAFISPAACDSHEGVPSLVGVGRLGVARSRANAAASDTFPEIERGTTQLTAFEVRTTPLTDTLWVELAGELDHAAEGLLVEAITIIREAHCPRIVLDMSRLTFMDAAGIRMFVMVERIAHSRHAQVTIVPGPKNVMRVLDIVGLADRYEVLPSRLATSSFRLDSLSLNP